MDTSCRALTMAGRLERQKSGGMVVSLVRKSFVLNKVKYKIFTPAIIYIYDKYITTINDTPQQFFIF